MSVALVERAARVGKIEVDELRHRHPHKLKKLLYLVVGDNPVFYVLFVERVEVLIHSAVRNYRARFLFNA